MKLTIPAITINIPTTTITNTITKLKALRTPNLPDLPLPHFMAILNDTLQDNILNKHCAHVHQARLHHLSNTYNVSVLQNLQQQTLPNTY